MKKKIAAAFILSALLLVSCGGSDPSPADDTAPAKDTAPVTIQTAGNWVEKDADTTISEGSYFAADVTGGELSIYQKNTEMSALYWAGTAPETVTAGETFVSAANHERTDHAILASSADEKEFAYDGEALSFEYTIMGVTRTVYIVPEP